MPATKFCKIFFDILYVGLRMTPTARCSAVRMSGEKFLQVFFRLVGSVRCPFCKEDQDKVVDSRSSDSGRIIRRRRQCLACERRFTTYEKVGESFKLYVVKKDDLRIPYVRDQVIGGLQ